MTRSDSTASLSDPSSRALGRWTVLLLAVTLTVPTLVAGLPAIVAADASTNAQTPSPSIAEPEPATDRYAIDEQTAWVSSWLDAMDDDANLVDDRADERAANALASGQPFADVSLLVTFDAWPDEDDRRVLEMLGGDVTYTFERIPTIEVEMPAIAVDQVGQLEGVLAVEWNEPMEPMLDVGPPAIQAREAGSNVEQPYNGETAEALNYTGEGQVIAVMDTGVRDDHDALEGKFVAGAVTSSGTTECVNPEDEDGHGTHVAGIAMGNEESSAFKGAAVDAELVDIKISAGGASIGGTNRGFEWIHEYNAAIENGTPKCGVSADDKINVATVSFGSTAPGGRDAGSSEPLIRDLNEQGVVVTLAAGNCGPEPSSTCTAGGFEENGISSPGNAAGAITVANVNDNGTVDRANDRINPSSSRGPNEDVSRSELTDRFRKPEIGAPGTNINSANSNPEPFVQYYELSGTSMSTPMVAGSAALLLQAGADVAEETDGVNAMEPVGTGYFGDGSANLGEHPVREAIVAAADYMTAGTPDDMLEKWESQGTLGETWNNAFGYGEANVFGAACWAWGNVLEPAGAELPSDVNELCSLEPEPLTVDGAVAFATLDETVEVQAQASGGQQPLTYEWTLVESPDNSSATIADPTGETTGFSADTPGAYLLEVTVTDDNATTATASTPVTVYEQPPTQAETFRSYNFENATGCTEEGWIGGQLLGFDGGLSGATTPWHLEENSAESEPCAWYHGQSTGTYENNQNTYLRSPGDDCFDLGAGLASANFTFPTAGTLEEDFDFMHVERSPCGADSWTTLASFTGSHGSWTTSPPVYEDLEVDLSDRIGGEAFQLRLRVRTDSTVTDVGYRVDSFELNGETPADNENPFATFTAECEEFNCTFDASASSDADGELLSHVWELSDGTTLLGDTVEHTFAEAGNHSATLTVTDDAGARNTVTQNVVVKGPLDVETVDPGTVEANETTTVEFRGSGFEEGVTISFDDGPGLAPSAQVTTVDPLGTFVEADVTVPERGPVDTTTWDVVAENPDGELDEFEDGLKVFRQGPGGS